MTGPDRLLITGSQTWKDAVTISRELAGVWWHWGCQRDAVMVSGHCPNGADKLCEAAWENHGMPVERHPARWRDHGPDCPTWCLRAQVCKRAGFRRDAEMAALGARLCLAFIDICRRDKCALKKRHGSHGASGTADMAEAAGIETRRIWHPDMHVVVDETQPALFT